VTSVLSAARQAGRHSMALRAASRTALGQHPMLPVLVRCAERSPAPGISCLPGEAGLPVGGGRMFLGGHSGMPGGDCDAAQGDQLGDAAHAELRAQVLERDQGSAGLDGAAARDGYPGWPPENIEEMAKKLEQEMLG
jgi:hypothetical protein